MRICFGDNMTKAKALAVQRVYEILEDEDKPLNTRQIWERLKDFELKWKSGRVSKARNGSMSMIQVSQVLSKSRWFKKVGSEVNYNSQGHKSGTIPLYVVANYPHIIEDMLSKTHRVLNPTRFPKFAKDEWLRQGGVI